MTHHAHDSTAKLIMYLLILCILGLLLCMGGCAIILAHDTHHEPVRYHYEGQPRMDVRWYS